MQFFKDSLGEKHFVVVAFDGCFLTHDQRALVELFKHFLWSITWGVVAANITKLGLVVEKTIKIWWIYCLRFEQAEHLL